MSALPQNTPDRRNALATLEALPAGGGAGAALRPAPSDYRGAVLGGLLTIAATFGGFGTWAALAPLNSAVVAHGTVMVDTNHKAVQHLEGGIVRELLVRDGDVVTAGDVLIRLDPTRADANLAIVQGQLDAARALEARLSAERDGADRIGFPETLTGRADDPTVAAIMAQEELVFRSRREARDGQTSILRQRIAQAREQISGLESQRRWNSQQIRLLNDELAGLRSLYEQGYAPRTRILALEREVARLEGESGGHAGDVARIEQSVGEAELQILQLTKSFHEEVATGLSRVHGEILDLTERLTASEDMVRRLDIRAPASGVVANLAVHTVGAVLAPGVTTMEIVPLQDRLVIEAQVLPTDIDDVRAGLPAEVRFVAFVQRTTPPVPGTVISVSPDRIVDQRSGTAFFLARILVGEDDLKLLGGLQILPGMPVDVMIETAERTALDYLVAPLANVFRYSMREH